MDSKSVFRYSCATPVQRGFLNSLLDGDMFETTIRYCMIEELTRVKIHGEPSRATSTRDAIMYSVILG